MSRIPTRFLAWTLAGHPNAHASRKVVDWATGKSWAPPNGGRGLIVVGAVGCVAGETEIDTPGGAVAIADLAARGGPFPVWSLDGDRVVGGWSTGAFQKGVAPLFRVTTSDGRSVTATANHLFLTPIGWQRLDQLAVGSLLGCGPVLRASSAEPVRAALPPDGDDCPETPGGSMGDCLPDLRPHDRQLLSAGGIAQSLVPSPGDAPEHTHVGFGEGDPVPSRGCTRLDRGCDRHASDDSDSWAGLHTVGTGYRRVASPPESPCDLPRSERRSPACSLLPHSGNECLLSVDPLFSVACAPLSPQVYHTLSEVSYLRTDEYFDMHVPGYQNYLAHGIWHHNTGKTGLAIGTLAWFSEHHPRTSWEYVSVPDLLESLRPPADVAVMDAYRATHVLVLDDLGTERLTDWGRERLYVLINHRWEWRLPTIVTTNFNLDGLKDHVGERIVSRLQDGAHVVALAGEDLRR